MPPGAACHYYDNNGGADNITTLGCFGLPTCFASAVVVEVPSVFGERKEILKISQKLHVFLILNCPVDPPRD